MAEVEREGTRNRFGALWCFIFVVAFGYGGIELYTLDQWWSVLIAMLLVFLVIVFLFVGFDYVVLAKRDSKGNRPANKTKPT